MGRLVSVEKYEELGLDSLEDICMHGMCQIMSKRVEDRLGLAQHIVVDYDMDVDREVLVHAFNKVPTGYVDASGIHDEHELTVLLRDEFEELDKFAHISDREDVQSYFDLWEKNLPLSKEEDFLMAWGEGKKELVESFLEAYVEEVRRIAEKGA